MDWRAGGGGYRISYDQNGKGESGSEMVFGEMNIFVKK